MAHDKYLQVRHATITKANALIQKSRFELTVLQQKIILYLISQIDTRSSNFNTCEFSISEFCRVCGIDEDSGGNYEMIRQQIKEIADKSVWVRLEDGTETLLRWIEKPYINKASRTILIQLDKDMKPYLLQLKGNFTKYELIWTLHFKSKYSIRLYELVKSLHYDEDIPYSRAFEVEELKSLMGAESYTTWQNFKARALEPAIKEINGYSDKAVSYETINKGRKIIKVILNIESKGIIEAMKIKSKVENEMGTTELTEYEEFLFQCEERQWKQNHQDGSQDEQEGSVENE